MFTAEYFRTRLRAEAEALGSPYVVEVFLVNGHSHRVRAIRDTPQGYVLLEVYQNRADPNKQPMHWDETPNADPSNELRQVALSYDGITEVRIDPATPRTRTLPGFAAALTIAVLALALPAIGFGQSATSSSPPVVLSVAKQIAAAVLPLPAEFRDSARVLGYRNATTLETLREGSGPFTCLANDPKLNRFHVACYHRSLEPFMARGRALRAAGITAGEKVDSARFAEIRSGKLKIPDQPAALYSLTGPATSFDTATGAVSGARPLFVIYIPNATGKTTGLSEKPLENAPWIMFPGTPKAHIMFVPKM
jgi:hypothetical protein